MDFSCRRVLLTVTVLLLTIGLALVLLEVKAEARAGGGQSGGSRGSRTFQSPSRPSQPTQPTQPRREATPPPQQPIPQPGGFMRSLAGGLLGGFLGALLFSGLSEAGWGGFGGSGIGLIEILLVAALGYLIYRSVRRPAFNTGYGSMPYQGSGYSSGYVALAPEAPTSTEPDFSSIRTMDASFDPGRFIKSAQDIFFKVQAAWSRQDTVTLNSLCEPELAHKWAQEVAAARARGEKNIIENIALRASEVTETWTEQGQDYVTVRIEATLLDYTTDEKNGSVIAGSRSEPVEFEEFWTFTRPVGPNPWKLTAVQQP